MELGEETQEDESGLLTILNVTRAHAGLYQCRANNGIAPPASVDVHLVVQCEFVVFVPRVSGVTYLWEHAHVLYLSFAPVLCLVSL